MGTKTKVNELKVQYHNLPMGAYKDDVYEHRPALNMKQAISTIVKQAWVGVFLFLLCAGATLRSQTTLLQESFDDDAYNQRGWYDNSKLVITSSEHIPNSSACVEFRFLKGARTPTNGGGIRRLFTPSNSVYLSLWIKYSLNWTGSNKPYHPHQFHFVTTEDDKYVGPAYTNLTLYIEENEGHPILAIQDAKNIDTTKIKVDLSSLTEQRALAGCNGSSDAYAPGDCYQSNGLWFNGKQWKSPLLAFRQEQGPYFQNDWHHLEAYFRLNTIESGKAKPDGCAQYWYDDSLLIDAQNIMLRTATHPTMMFNQFLIAPYIGDGSPLDQTMWVDELLVADRRPGLSSVDDDHADLSHDAAYIELVDLLGRTVLQFQQQSTNLAAELRSALSAAAPGVYLVRSRRGSTAQSLHYFIHH